MRRFLLERTGGAHGWVNELAVRSGVKRQTLSAWMGDRTVPDLDSLGAIAKALPPDAAGRPVSRFEIVAAMDGEGPVVRLDGSLRLLLREEIEAVLDERLGPRRAARG